MTTCYVNHIEKLLQLYPDKPWNWKELSRNPNITWEIVKANLNLPWNWGWLSFNPNIHCRIPLISHFRTDSCNSNTSSEDIITNIS